MKMRKWAKMSQRSTLQRIASIVKHLAAGDSMAAINGGDGECRVCMAENLLA